jgi:hypothetical protein
MKPERGPGEGRRPASRADDRLLRRVPKHMDDSTTAFARCGTITMAKRNYLVEGLSGAGKSSVYEELIRRGYKAISTDRAWAYHADPDTGLPGRPIRHDTFMWDQQKAVSELELLA